MSAGALIQPRSLKAVSCFLLQAFDVEGAARHEVAQVGEFLERTGELAGAAPYDGLRAGRGGLLGDRRVQRARAVGREGIGLRALGPLLQHHADDLRDHVAGALQDHGVADPDVLARDLVGVVQGGVLDHHAPDRHRQQPRHRGDRAGAAHLDVDGLQDRPRALGGELACDRPAGRAGDETQALLPVQAVDLVDHPVDVKGEMRPDRLHPLVGGEQAAAFSTRSLCGVVEKPQALSLPSASHWVSAKGAEWMPQA